MPNLRTYRVTLDITVNADKIAAPKNWDWGEIIDPDCSPYLWHTVHGVCQTDLNADHAHDLQRFNEQPAHV